MSGVTIQIGLGFILGCALTFLFVVSYVRNALRGEKMGQLATAMEKMAVRVAARFSVELLKVPEVNDAFTKLIAGGINAWLVDPEAQKHIESILINSSQEEAARELGKKLPGLVGSFSRGMFDGLRGAPKSKVAKIKESSPDSQDAGSPQGTTLVVSPSSSN